MGGWTGGASGGARDVEAPSVLDNAGKQFAVTFARQCAAVAGEKSGTLALAADAKAVGGWGENVEGVGDGEAEGC